MSFLKQHYKFPIKIKTRVSGNKISKRYLNNYLKENQFTKRDRVFLFYDLDIEGIFEKLKAIDGADLLITNPCIELWFLLHFEQVKHDISCTDSFNRLQNHLNGYQKGNAASSHFTEIHERVQAATNRARALEDPKNPCSTVFQLIDLLENQD